MTPLQRAELLSCTVKLAAEDATLPTALGANVGQLAGLGAATQALSRYPLSVETLSKVPPGSEKAVHRMKEILMREYPMGSSERMSRVVKAMGPRKLARFLLTYGLLGSGVGALGGYGLYKGYQALGARE